MGKGASTSQPAQSLGDVPVIAGAPPALQFAPSAVVAPLAEAPAVEAPQPAAAAPATTYTSGPQPGYSPQGIIRVANGTFVDDACREYSLSGWNQYGLPHIYKPYVG